MRVTAVVGGLMLFSRIESAAAAAGASLTRVDAPADVPADADLVLVDWSARRSDWADAFAATRGRIILFGLHTDLQAHADAGAAGLGPMRACSKLIAELARLVAVGDP